MTRSLMLAGVATLGLGLGLPGADAQTTHRHQRHPAAEGRQITVYGRESYLTLGTGADVGSRNGYALDTFGANTHMPYIDHTTVGMRGQNRLPTNFTVPGCCVP